MAIQIWSDGQYKSVDLAQYGADGALSGAYAWRDGAWRTLWERGTGVPEPLWVETFTAPSLNERWQLLGGDYTPPGLTDAAVLGPQISDSCVIGLTADPVGDYVQMLALDDGFSPAAVMMVSGTGYVSLTVGDFHEAVILTGTPSLRRQGGVWTVLVDGQPASDGVVTLSAPDEGGDLYLALEAADSTITQVSYTEL